MRDGIELPSDSSAAIVSSGLLGGKYLSLVPGGDDRLLKDGDEITLTQSSVNLEDLIGRYIFSGQAGRAARAARTAPVSQRGRGLRSLGRPRWRWPRGRVRMRRTGRCCANLVVGAAGRWTRSPRGPP